MRKRLLEGGFGIAVVIWAGFLVKRIDGGHDVDVDVVVIERVWRCEKYPIYYRLDDNGWLNGLFMSPNSRAKTLIRV